jgi:hypothetical protein
MLWGRATGWAWVAVNPLRHSFTFKKGNPLTQSVDLIGGLPHDVRFVILWMLKADIKPQTINKVYHSLVTCQRFFTNPITGA